MSIWRYRLFVPIGTLFVMANALGYYVGVMNSPTYGEKSAYSYIVSSWRRDDNDLLTRSGDLVYSYNLVSKELTVYRLPPSEAGTTQKSRYFIDELRTVYKSIGATSVAISTVGIGISAKDVFVSSREPPLLRRMLSQGQRSRKAAFYSAVTVGVVSLGYIGYEDERDYNDPDFIRGMNDRENWEFAALNISICDLLERYSEAANNGFEEFDVEALVSSGDLAPKNELVADVLRTLQMRIQMVVDQYRTSITISELLDRSDVLLNGTQVETGPDGGIVSPTQDIEIIRDSYSYACLEIHGENISDALPIVFSFIE